MWGGGRGRGEGGGGRGEGDGVNRKQGVQNKIAKARHPALYHNAARVCVGGGWTVRKRQVCRVATKCMAKF